MIDAVTGERKKVSKWAVDGWINVNAINQKTQKTVIRRSKIFLRKTMDDIYLLKLCGGVEITINKNHPFWISNNKHYNKNKQLYTNLKWQRLNELSAGEHLALQKHFIVKDPKIASSEELNEIEILAYLIGDGNITSDYPVFENSNICAVNNYSNCIDSLGGEITTRLRIRKNRKTITIIYNKVYGSSSVVRDILKKYNISGKQKDRFIPDEIFGYSEPDIAIFLGALYATDGCVEKTGYITYSTVSKELAIDLQQLLHRIGVSAKFYEHKTKSKLGRSYEVVICDGMNVHLFNDKVFVVGKSHLQRDLESKWNGKIETDIYFDRIKSIEYIGKDDVYDLRVEVDNDYVVNSMVCHNSGKDRTISKIQAYLIYKLLNLHDPQQYLHDIHGASLGVNSPIDIGNVSITSRQASNVFFKNFKTIIRNVINPDTGKNWFEEHGVDLREGYDIQSAEVQFPHNITAHSLNSETYIGEGLNLFFVAFDEFGAFKPNKAFKLLDALEETVISRFPNVGKVCIFSYKYYENDPMQVLYQREKNVKRTYRSKASTWEVNLQRKKSDFATRYIKNPEKAKMTYECEGGVEEGGYVTKKYMLAHMFDLKYENPIKGNLISVKSDRLLTLDFKSWFKGITGIIYGIHVDLAKGKIDKDGNAAGLSMVHLERMIPKIDAKLLSDLQKEGIIIEKYEKTTKKGVVVDLTLQIIAPHGGEIDITTVRKFIVMLKNEFNFNIGFATYDGWNSVSSIQDLQNEGINSYEISVDKTNVYYDTWKELMYQQIFKSYSHSIAEREAKELVLNDKGKVDHPEKSWTRAVREGTKEGSKDVMDSQVGAGIELWKNISLEPDIFFG